MIVQACLNGARPRDYHPRLPVTPAALAEDAAEAVTAGAAEIHLHVRGPDGAESLAPEAVDATVAALRARLPGTLVGVSTGAWIERDEDRRLALIDGWGELPDYASVNISEPGAPAVIERLRRRGIGVEAGLASAADAERLVRLGLAPLAFRVLIEIFEQPLDEAMEVTDAVLGGAGALGPAQAGAAARPGRDRLAVRRARGARSASRPASGSRMGRRSRTARPPRRTPRWSPRRSPSCGALPSPPPSGSPPRCRTSPSRCGRPPRRAAAGWRARPPTPRRAAGRGRAAAPGRGAPAAAGGRARRSGGRRGSARWLDRNLLVFFAMNKEAGN